MAPRKGSASTRKKRTAAAESTSVTAEVILLHAISDRDAAFISTAADIRCRLQAIPRLDNGELQLFYDELVETEACLIGPSSNASRFISADYLRQLCSMLQFVRIHNAIDEGGKELLLSVVNKFRFTRGAIAQKYGIDPNALFADDDNVWNAILTNADRLDAEFGTSPAASERAFALTNDRRWEIDWQSRSTWETLGAVRDDIKKLAIEFAEPEFVERIGELREEYRSYIPWSVRKVAKTPAEAQLRIEVHKWIAAEQQSQLDSAKHQMASSLNAAAPAMAPSTAIIDDGGSEATCDPIVLSGDTLNGDLSSGPAYSIHRSVAEWLRVLKKLGVQISSDTFLRRREGNAVPHYRENPVSSRSSVSLAIEDLPPSYSDDIAP